MTPVICDLCDKNPSAHRVWAFGLETNVCCQCHVKAGNAPADWHLECMRAYEMATVNRLVMEGEG